MSARGEPALLPALKVASRRGHGFVSVASVLIAAFVFLLARIAVAQPGDGVLGVWHTTDDKALVEIIKETNHFCAKIVSLKEPNWPANDPEGRGGKPKNDGRNPDPKLHSRTIAGIRFMTGFVYEGNSLWSSGRIYDPESGNTYRCKMGLVSTNTLRVHGYVGIPLFGRTVYWTRQAPK